MSKNGTIGRCKIVPKLSFEFSIYVSLALLRPKIEIIDPKYLMYALRSEFLQNQFIQRTKKDGGVGNLHLTEIKQSKIPIPQIDEQVSIVKTIDNQFNFLANLFKLKIKAEKKLGNILADVWGVEFVEPVIEEVVDEQEN